MSMRPALSKLAGSQVRLWFVGGDSSIVGKLDRNELANGEIDWFVVCRANQKTYHFNPALLIYVNAEP